MNENKCFCHLNGYEVKDPKARKILDGVVTPEMFGAVGDGITDDSEAINQALSVGDVINFKSGATYLLNSSLTLAKSNVIIDGRGATLKFSDEAGHRWAMLNMTRGMCENIVIKNLNFDDNYSRESLVITSQDASSYNMCISAVEVNNLLIENCNFKTGGVWCIFFGDCQNNDDKNDGLIIRNCHFKSYQYSPRFGGVDSSLVYCEGRNVEIYNNTFEGVNPPETALEIHNNNNVKIHDNIITNYVNSVILIIGNGTSNGSFIENNVMKNVAHGVNLWSGGAESNPLENIFIRNNQIFVNPMLNDKKNSTACGVFVNRSSEEYVYEIKNVHIENNFITFNNHLESVSADEFNSYAGVTLAKHTDNKICFSDIFIKGNTITNVDGVPIFVNSYETKGDVFICDNNIINCWCIIPEKADYSIYKAIIRLHNFTNAIINNNVMQGDYNQSVLMQFFGVTNVKKGYFSATPINQSDIVIGHDAGTQPTITQTTTTQMSLYGEMHLKSIIDITTGGSGYATYFTLPFTPTKTILVPIYINKANGTTVIAFLDVVAGNKTAYLRLRTGVNIMSGDLSDGARLYVDCVI